jgi:hypothetical protein
MNRPSQQVKENKQMSANKHRRMNSAYFFLVLALALGIIAPAGSVLANFSASGAANLLKATGPQPFDCSRIEEWGIDKMTNMRAYEILVQCGRVKPGGPTVPRAGAATRPIAGGYLPPCMVGMT